MARRRGSRFVRPAPRSMVWVGTGLSVSTTTTAATLLSSLNAAALGLRPFTVVRTRMGITLLSDQEAAGESSQGALGMVVVSDSAAAAGVASVPTPLTEVNTDFFVYKPLFHVYAHDTNVGFQHIVGDASVHWVDSKAMRKVDLDDNIVIVYEQRTQIGSLIAIEGRMLVKLH